MKINELKGKQLETLLSELFGLKGAKEIFARHNIEMKTKETELNGLENLLKGITKLLNESKVAQEYKQAVMFLDTQIKTNKSMLATAEGFMKTMIEGMIHSFETTKLTAVMSQSELFAKELEGLLDNILDETDVETIKGYISAMTLDKVDDFIKQVENIKSNISARYSGEEKVETAKETKPAKKETKKKEVSEENQKHIDDIEKQLVDLEEKEKKKEVEKPVEEVKEVSEENNVEEDLSDIADIDLDDGDFSDFDEQPEIVEEAKPVEVKPVEVKPVVQETVETDDFDTDLEDLGDFGDFDAEDKELNFDATEDIDPFM